MHHNMVMRMYEVTEGVCTKATDVNVHKVVAASNKTHLLCCIKLHESTKLCVTICIFFFSALSVLPSWTSCPC